MDGLALRVNDFLELKPQPEHVLSLFDASGVLFFRDNTHFQFQFFATRCH